MSVNLSETRDPADPMQTGSRRAGVITVLVADDHDLILQGLGRLLRAEQDIHIVMSLSDGFAVVEAVAEHEPNVAVIDLAMPGGGATLIQSIRAQSPGTRVVVLTGMDEPDAVRRAMLEGADGFVSKSAPLQNIVPAVRSVHSGYSYYCLPLETTSMPSILGTAASGGSSAPEPLSAREKEVLRLLAQGKTNREIATGLELSVKTVETYRTRLSQKTGLKTRSELVRFAMRNGL